MKSQDIEEEDIVKIKIDIRSEGLQKGDIGTVVMIYGNPPKDADVEFADSLNKGIKLVMVPLRYLEVSTKKV
ncbi:MAG: DUF4926 domain-containing protein [Nanoarchaeota archaeon]